MNNLFEAIEKSRQTTLDRVFVALGIANVGKKTARLLANVVINYKSKIVKNDSVMSSEAIAESRHLAHKEQSSEQDFSLPLKQVQGSLEMTQTIFSLTEEDLLEVKDIGPETARAFIEYVEENSLLIERLLHELDIQIPETRFLPSHE